MAKQMKSLKAKAETHTHYNVPRRIFDIESKASKKQPRENAESVLKRIASELQIESDLSQLKFEKAKKSILGTHVLFQQYHNKKPISGAWVRVDIDKDGRVYGIQNDLVPNKFLEKSEKAHAAKQKKAASASGKRGTAAGVTQDQVKVIACDATRDDRRNPREAVEAESCYFTQDGVPTSAWKVIVVNPSSRAGEWKVYVDAVTGEILQTTDLLKRLDGQGRVFDPNPVVTLNDTSLEDNSSIPDSAYSDIILRDLDNSGHLDGPFVSTKPTNNRVKRSNAKFLFERSDRAFKEVMVYFHIDRVQRYIQDLGFDNVLHRPIEVDVDGIPDDNSFYSPTTKSLTFGRGGVDDAEDADIILHEYGHAMQDDQMPGFGPRGESRAMGEGFGDYLAGSFFADVKADRLKPCVGTWDAVAYSGDDPPNLRRLDSNKKYPRDIVGEEHADGEIWSACLWEIRSAIGGRTADRIVIAHHFQLPNASASFEDAANALITVDQTLNQGRHEDVIRDVFVRRGILPNPRRKNRRAGRSFEDTHVHGK